MEIAIHLMSRSQFANPRLSTRVHLARRRRRHGLGLGVRGHGLLLEGRVDGIPLPPPPHQEPHCRKYDCQPRHPSHGAACDGTGRSSPVIGWLGRNRDRGTARARGSRYYAQMTKIRALAEGVLQHQAWGK